MHLSVGILASRALLFVAMLSAGSGAAFAGVITAVNGASLPPSSSATVGALATLAPNDDNPTIGLNLFGLQKSFGTLGFLDVEFLVLNSNGTTEYRVSEPIVANNTGVTWTDYHIELGFGLGADFVQSNFIDFLDFDTPNRDPAPVSTAFASLDHGSELLTWTAGAIASGAFASFAFNIDVPDYFLMPAGFEVRGPTGAIIGYRFTLRQYPSVPEPASLLLVGTGLATLIARRRRQ